MEEKGRDLETDSEKSSEKIPIKKTGGRRAKLYKQLMPDLPVVEEVEESLNLAKSSETNSEVLNLNSSKSEEDEGSSDDSFEES